MDLDALPQAAHGSDLLHAQTAGRFPGPPAAEDVGHRRHGSREFGFDPAPLEAATDASGFAA